MTNEVSPHHKTCRFFVLLVLVAMICAFALVITMFHGPLIAPRHRFTISSPAKR